MAIEIRALKTYTLADQAALGHGYTSSARYVVSKTETPERTVISLDLTSFDPPYVKKWDPSDEEELKRYQAYAALGYSLGAYDGETLAGLALTEANWWNRCLWIWEFHIAPSYRRQGIGRTLMSAVVSQAKASGFRIIGLETQNTNFPAICFYRTLGFQIEAVDLSFYTNTDLPDGEVAIFMKRKLDSPEKPG